MNYLDIENWNRKELFDHFRKFQDPSFALTVEMDLTKTYARSKAEKQSIFLLYLHACLRAINQIEPLKYRIEGDRVRIYERIDVSATIARPDQSFGFSYVEYTEDFSLFSQRFRLEKERIFNSRNLFPPRSSLGCIYCSAVPWLHFKAHKEPFMGDKDMSVPHLSFGKILLRGEKMIMPLAISVNHALLDGYHIGQFIERFQLFLDQ
ncbi:chloramphenicol O-acetyltransferase [Saprospira grandis DSM 2844]|uniref:Chloramphenicol O-acetyltransferase n=1 Tax=Saprospira grandis DSM 2844 TaxID=694433 RepID=J1I8B4_9BACT|nr:CatA-like O-acetyltransferase [Saprospira grandis]EJF54683.1 chloramphenicol O-acetyltransferase [Saprospira grandis DSM 2844]